MTKTMVFWICGGERVSGVLATQHPPFRYHCIIDHQPNICFFSFHFFPTKSRPRKERAEQGLVGETPQKNKEQFFTLFFIMMTDECRLQ